MPNLILEEKIMDEVLSFLPLILFLVFYFLIFAVTLLISAITTIIVGSMIGAVPLMCGLTFREKKTLGIIGFIACLAAYWMVGLFWSIVACLIFTYLIIKDQKKAEPAVEEIEEPATEE